MKSPVAVHVNLFAASISLELSRTNVNTEYKVDSKEKREIYNVHVKRWVSLKIEIFFFSFFFLSFSFSMQRHFFENFLAHSERFIGSD